MFETLQFVFVAALFADLVVSRGAQFLKWASGAEKTVVADVSKAGSTLTADVKADVKKVETTVSTGAKDVVVDVKKVV